MLPFSFLFIIKLNYYYLLSCSCTQFTLGYDFTVMMISAFHWCTLAYDFFGYVQLQCVNVREMMHAWLLFVDFGKQEANFANYRASYRSFLNLLIILQKMGVDASCKISEFFKYCDGWYSSRLVYRRVIHSFQKAWILFAMHWQYGIVSRIKQGGE